MRLVSICPSNTEIACAVGLGAHLGGLDRSSDWPPEVDALPRVGPDLTVDIEMQARLDAVETGSRALPRRARVFLEWWPKPVITPGRQCWTTEMMAIAGGDNVFADLDVRSTPIEDDAVPPRAPDLLLTCWCGVPHDKQRPAKMTERAGWEKIPGVVTGQVFAAEECYLGRPGPRLVDGVEWLHERIAAWA